MKASLKIEGAKEITRSLRQLAEDSGKRVVKRELKKAIKPAYKRTLELAPIGQTSTLLSAIRIKAGRASKGAIKWIVLMGEGDFKGKSFYGAFVNWGTKTKAGAVKIAARLFMTQAFDETKEQVKTNAETGILSGIEKEVKRLARRNRKVGRAILGKGK